MSERDRDWDRGIHEGRIEGLLQSIRDALLAPPDDRRRVADLLRQIEHSMIRVIDLAEERNEKLDRLIEFMMGPATFPQPTGATVDEEKVPRGT